MRKFRYRIANSACACIALFAVFQAQGAPSTEEPVDAVWRAQRLVFYYRTEGTLYSCEGLAGKTKIILRQLGAVGRLELSRDRCRDFAPLTRLDVLMETPVVATSENIRAITHYESEDVLIARVRGVSLPPPEDLKRFPAVWKTLTVREDCALVQQLRRQILPKMSVEVIKGSTRLGCAQANSRLAVLALVPASDERAGIDVDRAEENRVNSLRVSVR